MWKVDNFEDENLRNKTESNDKNRQKLEFSQINKKVETKKLSNT